MTRPLLCLGALLLLALPAKAQTESGLIAYFSFDNCDGSDDSGNGSQAQLFGNPGCECGAKGNALEFDGLGDYAVFTGIVNNYFGTDNFTVSFYFKSFGQPLAQDILSKREDCSAENAFAIQYTPAQFFVNAVLSQNNGKNASVTQSLDFSDCWHHLSIVREGGATRLYLNGRLEAENSVISRVELNNNAPLQLGNGPCIGAGVQRFKGYIDELRVYNRALTDAEAAGLYLPVDELYNGTDTIIFLGSVLEAVAAPTCAPVVEWTPSNGVADPFEGSTSIQPEITTTYRLSFIDQNGCQASDSIRITVVDPALLDCTQIFLPEAFTPNGDNLNDHYGISNPYAVEALLSFEIFDRWGGRVFAAESAFDTWDGSFRGEMLNPGVYLYKLRYRCKGEEASQLGSITLLR